MPQRMLNDKFWLTLRMAMRQHDLHDKHHLRLTVEEIPWERDVITCPFLTEYEQATYGNFIPLS